VFDIVAVLAQRRSAVVTSVPAFETSSTVCRVYMAVKLKLKLVWEFYGRTLMTCA